jgi:hypothetical protein
MRVGIVGYHDDSNQQIEEVKKAVVVHGFLLLLEAQK